MKPAFLFEKLPSFPYREAADMDNIGIDMKVADKDGKSLGTVDQVVNDTWTGEPRKFVIRLEGDAGALYFTPDQVASVEKGRVNLSLASEEMERT